MSQADQVDRMIDELDGKKRAHEIASDCSADRLAKISVFMVEMQDVDAGTASLVLKELAAAIDRASKPRKQ